MQTTLIYFIYSHTCLKKLNEIIQEEINKITNWLNTNILSINNLACVAGLLNIGLQQSQGNLVFRGRERTQNPIG